MTLNAAPAHRDSLELLTLPAPPVPGGAWNIHVYAHSHWDREWYRTFERFRMQLMGVVDRLIDVLDAQPEFTTFVLDGQTIVLEDYLLLRPEAEADLRRLVQAGRIEIGPWYVLPDEFLVSGESLVRNLEIGRSVAERFGNPLDVGYLPDPFGHIAQLPAILRGFGIDNVIFSRGMGDEWLETGNTFRWVAPSGDDVLALVQTSPYTSGYCNAELLGRGNDIDAAAPYEALQRLTKYHVEHASLGSMLWAAGCDHETVIEDLPARLEHARQLVGADSIQLSGLGAFVRRARADEAQLEQQGKALARHAGELRGSLHAPILASIFSARIELKQRNAQLQSFLERVVEPLVARAVSAGIRPLRDVAPILRHAWALVLENHAHDSIGGCSIDLVHDEMPARWLRAQALGSGLVEDIVIALGLQHEALVIDAAGHGGIATRGDGQPVAIAPLVPAVPVLLHEHQQLADAGSQALALTATSIDNGIMHVSVDDSTVTLQLRNDAGDVIAELEDAFGFIDEADAGDEYDFGLVAGDTPRHAQLMSVATSRPAPGIVQMTLQHELQLPRSLSEDRSERSHELVTVELQTTLRLTPGMRHVDATTRWINTALDHRLRLRSGVVTDAEHTVSDGHFALATRPITPPFPAVEWRQQPPGIGCMQHMSMLVSQADVVNTSHVRGVAFFGRGLHEVQARPEPMRHAAARLELTIGRSVGWLSRGDITGRPGHAGPELATPDAQCLGPQVAEWAITLVSDQTPDQLAAQAQGWAQPPLVIEPVADDPLSQSGHIARMRDVVCAIAECPGGATDVPRSSLDLLQSMSTSLPVPGGSGVVWTSLRIAADGSGDVLARCWSSSGGTAELDASRVQRKLTSTLVRIDGLQPLGDPVLLEDRWTMPVEAGGILTIRLARA